MKIGRVSACPQVLCDGLASDLQGAMDNCGTGGDQSYSFNISTTASFVLAAGGIRMAKAGNRSISSKSGSADVLEALGINVSASPETLSKALDEVGLAFIFAQTMHPAMRFIGPARQALGIPTIMNLVGPLANPLDLETQLMGLYRVEVAEIVANAIQVRSKTCSGSERSDKYGRGRP